MSTASAWPPSAAADTLRQARQAIAQGDLQRADALFVQYLQGARGDGAALAEYGNFCLRTARPEESCYLSWKAVRLGHGDADAWAELGHARLETGDAAGARDAFAQALALDARHAVACYGLAECLSKAQQWPEAVAAYSRALAGQAGNVPILVNLGIACWRAGDQVRAADCLTQAERIAPGEPLVLLESGRFLRETGAAARALLRLQRCDRAWPGQPAVLLELAHCLRVLGQIDHAMQTLAAIDALAPAMPECHVERGHCLAAGGDLAGRDLQWELACRIWLERRCFDEAAALLKTMLAAAPDSSAAWNSQGSLHDLQQQIEPAEAAYRRAIALDPDALGPRVNLGTLLETSNRREQAAEQAREALRIAATMTEPDHPAITATHLLIAKLARRDHQYPNALAALDRAAAAANTGTQRQTTLFERARILDLQGDTDGAMATFAQANAIAVLEPGVDDPEGNKFSRGVDYLLGLVAQGWLDGWRLPPREPTPDEPPAPVFLLGFPRSGTTLLNTVLFSHSAITVLEEKQTFSEALALARRMPGGYPHAMPGCDALDARLLRETYWRAVRGVCSLRPGQLLIDKFPFYLTLAGLIHVAFPNAKFLFAQRHPCDAVLSCFMQNFRLNEGMANFRTLADTASIYDRTMRLWQAFRDRLQLNVHTVRYEGMVEDFDGEVRALCDFLGVPWEESLRQFASKALDRGKINTPSYEQVSRPIYREARGRWQRYRRHLEPHLPLLQPWIERYGYREGD